MRSIVLLIGGLMCLLPHAAFAQDLTQAEALEEAELVYEAIFNMHPDPTWFTSQEDWDAEITRLRGRSGAVSHVTQYFDLARLMSLATDTHVQVYPVADTPGFETSYPVRFRLFEEGIFVIAADDPYRDWVGARVVSVAGRSSDEIVAALAQFASADHQIRKESWGISYLMRHPATYVYNGWSNEEGGVDVVLEFLDGTLAQTALRDTVDASFDEVHSSGTAAGYFWPEGWRTLEDIAPGEAPLYRRHMDQNYWYTDLDDGRVVYFQFNVPNNQDDGQSIYDFILEMFTDIGSRETAPERIIVDARHNLGGWIDYTTPFSNMFLITETCCRTGGIVVLAGRETISAGSVFVGSMERTTGAVVIGEPTGGRPYIFLGQQGIELPYSGLEPEVSRYALGATDSTDTRMYVAPDVAVPERFSDVIAGRDAALEAALALTQEDAAQYYPGPSRLYPWLRPSQAAAHH